MNQQVKELIHKKDQLQQKIAALDKQINVLNQSRNFEKGVVDQEGFPRADVDFGELANYRNLKRQKAQLNNDHFAIMKQIQSRLAQIHQGFPDVDPNEQEVKPTEHKQKVKQTKKIQQQHPKQQKKQHNIDYITPFAKISHVQHDSPAFKAGLKVGDLVSEFGQVTIYTINNLKQIPKHVKQEVPIQVVVMRPQNKDAKGQGVFKLKDENMYRKTFITVVPSLWAGRGLLGCKIDPLM